MTTTTLNKTARTVVASQSAAVGTPVRGTLDLRTVQGGILFAKITNGSSGPTEPCALIISAAVSDGATPASGAVGATWQRVMTFAGTTAANDVTDWALDIPPVQHLQVEFSGNTGQAVTVEAFFSEITSAWDFEAQISALFASGEQGAWYDPSDLSTLYQDAAGTTPVTALGQPVGLMLDKSKGLVRGPELWPQTALNAAAGLTLDANWTIAGGVATSDGGSGFIKVTVNPLTLGKWYEATMDVASYASGSVYLPYDGAGTSIVSVASAGSYRRVFMATRTDLRVYSHSFVGSIDNISVRELPGNHASQPTATARPTLQARVNLLPATEGDLVGWIRQRGSIVTGNAATAPDGTTTAIVLTSDGSDSAQSVYPTLPCVINTDYVTRVYLRGITTTQAYVNAYNGVSPYANIAQSLRVVTGAGYIDGNFVKGLSTSDWTLVEIASKPTEVVFRPIAIFPGTTSANPAGAEIAIWHPQTELGSTATTYQRVTTATDYADVGAKRYLEFDGVDDLLATTFPDLGANVTIGRSLRTTGASILTGQTIGAGVRNDSTTHHGLVIINRALTAPETASLTRWLNRRAGV